jgi:hypothetical protein
MEINYLDIILEYVSQNKKLKYLPDYFIREAKKAKEIGYAENEFFDGLLSIIDVFEKDINDQIIRKKEQLGQLITIANNMPGNDEILAEHRQNYKSISKYDFWVNLSDSKKYGLKWFSTGHLTYYTIEDIKEAIDKAYNQSGFPTKDKKAIKQITYVWQSKPDDELPELYSLMIDQYKLIAPDTTYERFKAVFTGQLIDESFEPIRWHQDNASELLYFIDKLEQSNNIEHNPKRADYQKLKACFVKPDGKQFNEALKTLKQQIQFIAPDKQKAIDELVNNF